MDPGRMIISREHRNGPAAGAAARRGGAALVAVLMLVAGGCAAGNQPDPGSDTGSGNGAGPASGADNGGASAAPATREASPGGPPGFPPGTLVVELAGEFLLDPDHRCGPPDWPGPSGDGSYSACVLTGELRELSGQQATVIVLFGYPAAEPALFGWAPVPHWLATFMSPFDDWPRLTGCSEWRGHELAGEPAIGCQLEDPRRPQARIALASDQLLILAGAEIEVPAGADHRPAAAHAEHLAGELASRLRGQR